MPKKKPSQLPIKFFMTAGVTEHFSQCAPLGIIWQFKELWKKYPIDMYVFESVEKGKVQISITGYNINTDEDVKKTVVGEFDIKADTFPKLWLKIDNYGEYLVATLLFPDEY